MAQKKESPKRRGSGAMTPGVIVLLSIVGVFAVLLMTVALLRGAM